MRDFSVSRSFALMRRTAPFLMFRSMVFVGIALGFVLATGLGAGIGYGMGAAGSAEFQDNTVFWGGASGFGLMAGVVFLVRDLLLSGVRVSHAAAMVEVLQGGVLPEGRAQILRAQTMVTQRFGPAGALFALDRAIRGVIAAVVRDLAGAGWGAARGIVAGLAGRGRRGVLRLAAAQMNEVILATAIRSGADSPAACARAALVLWAQNAAPVLVGAAWLALLSYALALGVFLAMLAPAAGVDYLLPGGWAAGRFIFALIFAWAVKAALIEPFVTACLLQAFLWRTVGQSPDPEWEARLQAGSSAFRTLGERAAAEGAETPGARVT